MTLYIWLMTKFGGDQGNLGLEITQVRHLLPCCRQSSVSSDKQGRGELLVASNHRWRRLLWSKELLVSGIVGGRLARPEVESTFDSTLCKETPLAELLGVHTGTV